MQIQETLNTNMRQLANFLAFAKSYIIRNNPIKMIITEVRDGLKDLFSMTKKKKIARYRLNYQIYKLQQMESLIMENNEHVFLKGRKFNELR